MSTNNCEQVYNIEPSVIKYFYITYLDNNVGYLKSNLLHSFSDMDRKYFWAWTDFQSYVDCMLVFSVLGSAVMYLMIEFTPFVELIGFLAVFTEAMLGAPQIAKNHQNKSTEGMRLVPFKSKISIIPTVTYNKKKREPGLKSPV